MLENFLFILLAEALVLPLFGLAAGLLYSFGRQRYPTLIPRLSITILVLPLACPLGGLAWAVLRYGYGPAESLDWLVTVGDQATHYAPGYSDVSFCKIKPGMTKHEVLAILGEPYGGSQENEISWWYSGPDNANQDFHMRTVEFSAEGIVLRTVKTFCAWDE